MDAHSTDNFKIFKNIKFNENFVKCCQFAQLTNAGHTLEDNFGSDSALPTIAWDVSKQRLVKTDY